ERQDQQKVRRSESQEDQSIRDSVLQDSYEELGARSDADEATSDPISKAMALADRLEDERYRVGQTAWEAPFMLARMLLGLGGKPGDYRDAIEAFADRAGLDFEEVYYGVLDCWEKVRFPEGQDTLTKAVDLARQYALKLPEAPTELYN